MTVTSARSGRNRRRGVSVDPGVRDILAEDGRIQPNDGEVPQQSAARLGFGPQDGQMLARVMAELKVCAIMPDQVLGIDPPDYDTLKALTKGVPASYTPAGRFESSPEDDQ